MGKRLMKKVVVASGVRTPIGDFGAKGSQTYPPKVLKLP